VTVCTDGLHTQKGQIVTNVDVKWTVVEDDEDTEVRGGVTYIYMHG
jgi:hypothetical protein